MTQRHLPPVPIHTLQDLFIDQLRDIYSVECQLVAAQAELAVLANGAHLQGRLREHGAETRRHKQRLVDIGRAHGFDLEGGPSKVMEGLIAGGRAHLTEADDPYARDFLLIAHSHRIEHYEIAAYGVAVALARQIGLHAEAEMLSRSLNEEREMDAWLTRLASGKLLGRIPAN
jgi:ferritin-like metal-binding protein YciE